LTRPDVDKGIYWFVNNRHFSRFLVSHHGTSVAIAFQMAQWVSVTPFSSG
jgi:hypothetical protein